MRPRLRLAGEGVEGARVPATPSREGLEQRGATPSPCALAQQAAGRRPDPSASIGVLKSPRTSTGAPWRQGRGRARTSRADARRACSPT